MELIFQYPIWFIVFCFVLGAIYAGVLYFKSNHFSDDAPHFIWVKRVLAALRFTSVSILAFLLLSPFIKSKFVDKVNPIIVFAHDNSESILLNLNQEDSTKYINNTNKVLTQLAEKYQIDYYVFDKEIKEVDTLDFKGKSSNLSNALNQINGLYFNQNVGAVIFATDGIYNEGNNPIYNDFSFPIYTVALGDTNQQTDIKIVNVRNNKIAYLDDKVQVEVDLQANHLQGKSYQLSLSQKENIISNKTLAINKDFDEQSTSFTIDANAVGIQKYRLALKEVENEITTVNNYYDFYIEVIDNRQKILLVANAPHPDIAAIKSVVETNKNFEIEVQYANKYSAVIGDYSLIIAHQIPSKNANASNVLNDIKNSKTPTWFITGTNSNYTAINQAQNIVQLTANGNNKNDASPYLNTTFNSYNLSENTLQSLKKFPPVIVPFGNYSLGAGSNIILKQKIGAVDTDFPILAFQENLGTRSAIFIGDGLWRWKLHDYLEHNSTEAFNEIVEKTINYLALKGDKRKFRVNTNKNAFIEGENIDFEAELYNDAYELVNEPEVTMIVKNEKGDEFPFTFTKTAKAYQYKTNSLPIGNYTYTANTTFDGKKLSASGAFTINATQLEALHTQANHLLLKQLADKTNGQFIDAKNVSDLSEILLNKEEIKPVLYESFKTRPIINLFGLFFVIMTLLSVEWFARKWFGAY